MIGGEFPLQLSEITDARGKQTNNIDAYAYASGRAALYQILNYLKKEKKISHILIPDYLCESILISIRKHDFSYTFYPINEILELEPSSFKKLYRKDASVLIINYFGLKDLTSQIEIIRNIDKDAIIIEDDVQAYFEFKKPLNGVDFKFTSLRKTFSIPEGGLVKTSHSLPIPSKPNTFGKYKIAAALLKAVREELSNDNIYLELSEKGESIIENEMDCGISDIALKLYQSIDEKRIQERRINNAKYLIERLDEIGIQPILPLNDSHVPLFVPVLLNNRDSIRKEMFRHEIYCPVHWPLRGQSLKRGKIMDESELSLIIDQRYHEKDMNILFEIIKNG